MIKLLYLYIYLFFIYFIINVRTFMGPDDFLFGIGFDAPVDLLLPNSLIKL